MFVRHALICQGKRPCFLLHRFLSNYYNVVGVNKSATKAEIKSAYFSKAKTCHPDHFPGDKHKAKEFLKLQEAYEVLSDKSKRAYYDQTGGTKGQKPSYQSQHPNPAYPHHQQSNQQSHQQSNQQSNQQYQHGSNKQYDEFLHHSRTRQRKTYHDPEQARQQQDFQNWILKAHESRRKNSSGNQLNKKTGHVSLLKIFLFVWFLTVFFRAPRGEETTHSTFLNNVRLHEEELRKERDKITQNKSSFAPDDDGKTVSDPNVETKKRIVKDEEKENDQQAQRMVAIKQRMEELKKAREGERVDTSATSLHNQAHKEERMRLYEEQIRKKQGILREKKSDDDAS